MIIVHLNKTGTHGTGVSLALSVVIQESFSLVAFFCSATRNSAVMSMYHNGQKVWQTHSYANRLAYYLGEFVWVYAQIMDMYNVIMF